MRWRDWSKASWVFTVVITAWAIGPHAALADFMFGEPENLKSLIPVLNAAYDGLDCFSYDGLEMYIDSMRPGGYGDWDLWVLRRTSKDGDWGLPENLGPVVNSASLDSEASISADGLELYFTSKRPGGGGPADIYMTTRATTNTPWAPPINLGATINSPYHDSEPWITADGLELYFGSSRPGGHGELDIYVTTRVTKNAAWVPPVNLGSTINSSANDGAACISADGRMLCFVSVRSGGYGKMDIWMARRASVSHPWEPPVNLGSQVNGSADDSYPRISLDGRTLYFWSNRSGDWDSYWAQVIPIVDFNGDGKVDLQDLVMLTDNWGTDNTLYDIGPYAWGDGKVDAQDLLVLAQYMVEHVSDVNDTE